MRIASTLPQLGEISCSESSHVPRPIRTREADPSKFFDCQSIRLSTAFISSISQRRDTMIWPNSRVTCPLRRRSEEHTSELQSLMRISYAVFRLIKKKRYYPCLIISPHQFHTRYKY